MGSHPLNLALRFILELWALISMGFWGWNLNGSPSPLASALAAPIAAAAIWGTFAVPGDPSRSGKAPVPVPGILRLLLELVFFLLALWMLYQLEYLIPAIIMAALLIFHYAISYDRILWLVRRNGS